MTVYDRRTDSCLVMALFALHYAYASYSNNTVQCACLLFSSFGHQSAKLYGVAEGYKSKKTAEEQMKVKLGLAITRQSVLQVVQHLLQIRLH